MVFQHFSLFEALDVAENVALGMETPPPMRELAARIRADRAAGLTRRLKSRRRFRIARGAGSGS